MQVIWQKLLWWRYLLFQRHRHNNLVLEQVMERPFLVLPEVLNPKLFQTGELIAHWLTEKRLIPADSAVLDMGTGSGVGAVAAAQWARCVVALDINPAAVRCARINTLLNSLEDKITVYESDLFTAVPHQQFDVILFNPPYYRGEPKNMLDRAFYAMDVVERFTAELPSHLTPTGYALVLLSSTGDEQSFLDLFQREGFVCSIAARQTLPTEVVTFYQLCLQP